MCSSYGFVGVSLSLFLFAIGSMASNTTRIFNVIDYGAVADGKTDSTQAFQNAWNEACASDEGLGVLIPEGSFLVGPLIFKGPCKNRMVFQLKGAMLATSDLTRFSTEEWITFRYIDGLLITGGGKFDGQGSLVWHQNNCRTNKNCKRLPDSINFSHLKNVTVEDISSVDSKSFHLHLFVCDNMKLNSLKITAPAESPNTDGIHLGDSSNIEISNTIIGTGDDCVSIGPGNENISVSKVFCGPGHGISVGSLGGEDRTRGEADVVGLSITNCTLTGTTNGVRIKTWHGSPIPSSASNLTFDDIVMRNVENPIVIDQKYCPSNLCSQKSSSKVSISNVKFRNIRGETKTKVAVNLVCSDAVPCQDIELGDIDLKYIGQGDTSVESVQGEGGGEAMASCINVKGHSVGVMNPPSCL